MRAAWLLVALAAFLSASLPLSSAADESAHPVEILASTMFTPGNLDADMSFEDALLSAPHFSAEQHPQWQWLQQQTGALRHAIVADVSETHADVAAFLHTNCQGLTGKASAGCLAQKRRFWRKPTNGALRRAYKRIHKLFRSGRDAYIRGQRMKHWHLNALKEARSRLDKIKAKYAELHSAWEKLEEQGRAADAREMKRLEEAAARKATMQAQSVMIHNKAASTADMIVAGLKSKMLTQARELRDLVHGVLETQRDRDEAGLPAMSKAERRQLRSFVRKELRSVRQNLKEQISRTLKGESPIPTPPPAVSAQDAAIARLAQNAKEQAKAASIAQQAVAKVVTAAAAAAATAAPQATNGTTNSTHPSNSTVAPAPIPVPVIPVTNSTTGNATQNGVHNNRDTPLANCVHALGPTGQYWLKDGKGRVYLGYCLQQYAGGGWTLVTEPDHDDSQPGDGVVDEAGTSDRHIFDLRGRDFSEVLVRRTSNYWCDSFGQTEATVWGNSKATSSMGVSVDGVWYNYGNAARGGIVRQRLSSLEHWGEYQEKHNIYPWNGKTFHPTVRVVKASRAGDVVRIIPSSTHNHYLEIDNLNSVLGSFGGCDVEDSASFEVFIRPYDPRHKPAATGKRY